MKCEKCNDREANFFYTVTINGETSQTRLCSECARREGLMSELDLRTQSLFGGFFPSPVSMLDGFFSAGAMAPALTMPRFAMRMPALYAVCPVPGTQAEREASAIPEDAGEEVKAKRELQALKHQLEQAVIAEDFEKAIELRDRIRGLE